MRLRVCGWAGGGGGGRGGAPQALQLGGSAPSVVLLTFALFFRGGIGCRVVEQIIVQLDGFLLEVQSRSQP